MTDFISRKQMLLEELSKLQQRYELSKTVGPDYFEPGMMEFLDQSFGSYDESTGSIIMRFEARGTRYEGRTERMENVHVGDEIRVTRDIENQYNSNNFTLLDAKGRNLGNMSASMCNALAPLYDSGEVVFEKAFVSYVEPISKRGRHAKQAILFVELQLKMLS